MLNRSKLSFVLFFICFLTLHIFAQETYSEEDLQALTEEELEKICLVRGFELLKNDENPDTGEKYELTHQDYVEAAKQCLAIEQEMNELLESNPELRDELQAELAKLQEAQDTKKAEIEELQSQLDNKAEESKEESDSSPQGEGEDEGEDDEELQVSEEEPIAATVTEEDAEEVPLTTEDTDQQIESSDSTENDASASAIATPDANNSQEDLTLKEISRAFIEHVQKDIQRIRQFLIPVFEPMLHAGNLAVKYARALFITIRQQYASSSQREEEASTSEKGSDEAQVES